MAGRKRDATGRAKDVKGPRSSVSTRSRTRLNPDVPDVYREMLSEVDVRTNAILAERPVKKRRAGQRIEPHSKTSAEQAKTEDDSDDGDVEFEDVSLPLPTIQTIERDSDEDDEDEDVEEDVQFQDVDVTDTIRSQDVAEEQPKDIELNLSTRANITPRRTADRRKPINKAEKDRRIEIHKTHLLCLMSHVARRNRWCNDSEVQDDLQLLLTSKMIKYLNPGADLSQFGRANSLKDGLQQVGTLFKTKFRITERGLRRALWAENEDHLKNYKLPDDVESPMEQADFREAAKTLQGSRDVGAQLYCALLRSVGVQARLVCSLQPLSFGSGGPYMGKPPKPKGRPSLEERYDRFPRYDSSFDSPSLDSSPALRARRRLGHPSAAAFHVPPIALVDSPQPGPATPKTIRESPFPVYWVEILDEAHQKWQPTDPLVTDSFWKPQKLEPPSTDRENYMAYVVSFEADGTARDVTRRYAKAYNAKTRKMRIESAISDGEKWWRKALRAYSRGYKTDLDQIEDHEMAAAESREPMPRNVADFKDHPIFALERHLRRHEVLVPGASWAGTVGAGSRGPLEKIYRRQNVRVARSREKWYRLGREVRPDEIPVKFLTKRAKATTDLFGDEADDGDLGGTVGTPLYVVEQTELYKAPPIIDGRIPKNRYGNLDIYMPSMVPEGGAYITDDLGARASFVLGIDYAPALTGFHFSGRHGTAVLHGVVVAAEHEQAVRAVISGLKDQEAEIERERRTREVLKAWRLFLMNLRVRQRIWAGADSDDDSDEGYDQREGQERFEPTDEAIEDAEAGGEDEAQRPPDDGDDSDEAGGFLVDDDYAGGFVMD